MAATASLSIWGQTIDDRDCLPLPSGRLYWKNNLGDRTTPIPVRCLDTRISCEWVLFAGKKVFAAILISYSSRRNQDFVSREIVHDFCAVFGDDQHVFQARAADPRFALARFHGYRHAFFEYLRVLERPQPINDRNIVTGAGAQADAVTDLAGENLDRKSVV